MVIVVPPYDITPASAIITHSTKINTNSSINNHIRGEKTKKMLINSIYNLKKYKSQSSFVV